MRERAPARSDDCRLSESLAPRPSLVMCRHVLLGFGGRSADPFLVAGLDRCAAAGIAFVEQLREEVVVPVLVEDQFALGWRGAGLGGSHLEQGRSLPIPPADFHVV